MTVLLIIYGIFLLGILGFGGAGVYHANKFGFPGDRTRLAVLLYVVATVTLVVASFILLGQADTSELEF